MSPTLLSRIEDATLNASAPPAQRWLDGWLIRTSPGKAKRARSVHALATGVLPLDERIELAAQVYAEAGLPLLLRITPFTQPATLDAELAGRGWTRFDDTRVMVAATLPTTAADVGVRAVDVGTFAQTIGALRGSPAGQRAAHAERLRASGVPFEACVLEADGRVVACGQSAREHEFVGLYDVFTVPEARGRGLAGALCTWLLARAQAAGARHGYLQVDADNAPARAVYRRLGFVDGYAYHYRTPAGSGAA